MTGFSDEVLQATARLPEVELVTYGRKTGEAHRTTIWVWGDGRRIFIRSGGGLGRDWPQNLLARGRAVLHLGDLEVPVVPRHVTDLAEARSLHPLAQGKYGASAESSIGSGDTATPAEEATFELLAAPTA
ncbi:MAG: hypothetical protein ACREQM_13600 [Candidatus Dormibacteraceae bacterium]